MEKYIAAKPVRFDRDYEVGDEIPSIAIDPRMEKRLIEAGKIARVTAPNSDSGDGEPQINLIGYSLEQSVVFVEDILGIDHSGEEPPDLETRAKTCKEIVVEIKNAVGYLKTQNDGTKVGEQTAQTETQTTKNAANSLTCDVCGKVCGSKAALTTHKKTHEVK